VRICRLAVVEDITISAHLTAKAFQERVKQPAVTRTCRAIRYETLAAFYGNHFTYMESSDNYGDDDHVLCWLGRMTEQNLTNFTMRCYPGTEHWWQLQLEPFGFQLQYEGGSTEEDDAVYADHQVIPLPKAEAQEAEQEAEN